MAWSLPRLLREAGAALVHTQYALPLALPVPGVVTIHDLSFERDPTLMSRRDRAVFRRAVPRAARARRPGADRLGALEARTSSSSTGAAERDRGDAERRRPGVRPGRRRARATTCSPSAPSSRARTSSPRSRPRRRSGCRSSSSGRRRTPRSRRELRKQGATLRGYVDDRGARRALPRRRVPRAGVALRGLRPAGARGDGVRHAGRHGAATRRSSRSSASAAVVVDRATGSRTGSAARSPTATSSPRRASSGRALFSWRAAAERTVARLPGGARR